MEKRLYLIAAAVTVSCALASSSRATDLVNDTWLDGSRSDPTSSDTPAYAENNGVTAVDSDSDTNLESAWFKGGGGTLNVTNTLNGSLNTDNTSGNVMEGVTSASSQHWYTYFTQPSTKVTLANPGDELKLTWVFKPQGTIGNNVSQALPVALALNPNARVTGDGTLPSGVFSGYSMFLNFSTTLSGSAFALKEWITTASSSLLGASAAWGANGAAGTLANGGAAGNTGYASGTQYTFVFDLQLDPGGSGNLIINSSMTGGSLNNGGVLSVTYTDASPNSLSYDTFDVRPANAASTAGAFDTSLFKIEVIPEPSTFMLAGSGLVLMMGLVRRRRRS